MLVSLLRTGLVWWSALVLGLSLSCSRTEREVVESINPAVMNYYLFTQGIYRLRNEIRTAPSERLNDFLPRYSEILSRGQSLRNEVANMKEVRKHRDLLAALDSSLQTQLTFLKYERQALGALLDYRAAEEKIDRLKRQVADNTLTRRRLQPELDAQMAKAQESRQTLETLKPKLLSLSRENQSQMQTYNQLVLERKIVGYTSSNDLLAPFDWQKPPPAMKKKSVSKKGGR